MKVLDLPWLAALAFVLASSSIGYAAAQLVTGIKKFETPQAGKPFLGNALLGTFVALGFGASGLYLLLKDAGTPLLQPAFACVMAASIMTMVCLVLVICRAINDGEQSPYLSILGSYFCGALVVYSAIMQSETSDVFWRIVQVIGFTGMSACLILAAATLFWSRPRDTSKR